MVKKIVAAGKVVYWFMTGASKIYPDMTRWEIAKKIWKNATKEM